MQAATVQGNDGMDGGPMVPMQGNDGNHGSESMDEDMGDEDMGNDGKHGSESMDADAHAGQANDPMRR
eukprot:6876470-Alexandrium_andersonii.AAC.1